MLFQILLPFYLKTGFRRQRIRYMSLTLTDLEFSPAQLNLFGPSALRQKEERLIAALDAIREKYGSETVWWGKTRFHGNPA